MAHNFPLLAQNGAYILPPKTLLGVNQYLQSPSGRFKLIHQEDVNLVLWDGDKPIWALNGSERFVDEFYPKVWRDDHSQVYMNHSLGIRDLKRSRIASTMNSDAIGGEFEPAALRTHLQLQDDGNLVIVTRVPRWEAQGVPKPNAGQASTIIPPATMINPGDTFRVGKSRLVFQGDGNLVFYGENDQVLWASYTHNKGGAFAAMQADGNFVIYNAAKQPIWETNTDGAPDAYARIQENGSFAIITDHVSWARFGYTPTIKPVRIISFSGNPYKDGLPTYDHVVWTF